MSKSNKKPEKQEKKRDWNRDPHRAKFLPTELLIAGVDFPADQDDPLRDEPSKGREIKDEQLLDLLRSHGFIDRILVTKRVIEGEVCPVVINGRRRVRLSRIINEERMAKGLEPLRWHINFQVTRDSEGMEIARALNQGQAPETLAQIAHYFVRLVRHGHTDETAAKLLGTSLSAVPHLRAVADPQCADWVYDALDRGHLGLQAAAMIARLSPEEQEQVRERLGDKTPTTAAVRAAVAKTKGVRAAVPPSKKRVRALLEDKRAKLSEDFRRGILFMLGEIQPSEVGEIAEIWDADDKH